ncbi:unnamed protein product [Anisakis simplex]|uniref:Activator of 90 kDa heat shock protein ATPase homolog 1 (inferred by orthology to a human protein) n=1 Tax=Anisakis simplex TaxID=6269 RepID=A0A0M3JRF6_ANISI|nr:unnamed protein product [Anisakis simplex]
MAKWGEGDPRWIVEERPDAVNVNNWHWTEKNATPWSKLRLKQLLEEQKIEKGPILIEFGEFKKLDGEATANNRKAKLIFLFEWIIELNFNVKVAGSDVEYKGYIEIPNLSDENEADEVDVTLSLDKSGPHEAEIRQLFNKDVTEFVRKQLAVYIRELKEEFSQGIILPTDRSKPQVVSKGKTTVVTSSTSAKAVDKKTFQNHVRWLIFYALFLDLNFLIFQLCDRYFTQNSHKGFVVTSDKSGAPAVDAAGDVDVTSITSLSEEYKIQPSRLWEVLTEPELVKKWSGTSTQFDLSPNGGFSMFNSTVTGQFVRIEQNKELAMKWRLKTYPSQHFANVRLLLKDQGDCTKLEIEANGVPKMQCDETENGLRRFYLQSISRTFGFGANIF